MIGQPTRNQMGIDKPVVAARHYRGGNVEKESRRLGLGLGQLGDPERAGDEGAEHGDGSPVCDLLSSFAKVAAGRLRGARRQQPSSAVMPLPSGLARNSLSKAMGPM